MSNRPHVFMYDSDSIGCRHCPLPRRNRVHDVDDITVPDITEPARAAADLPPHQLTLPKPRKSSRNRRKSVA